MRMATKEENMKRNRFIKNTARNMAFCLAVMLALGLSACGGGQGQQDGKDADNGQEITVVSREDGAGTRDAFVEVTGVKKDGIDRTADTAEITNSTSVVIQSVAGNKNAIGYISMGAMSESVKPVKVNGVEASADSVKSGDYDLQRPFHIVTKGKLSKLAQDFVDFIMSADGQSVIEEEGYIAINNEAEDYQAKNLSGSITLAGSTSVAPVMEVLADRYKKQNPGVSIEIQQTGSGAGIQSTIEGVCDIGMASRQLVEEEKERGIDAKEIALDGIAVIVNKENKLENLAMEEIRQIFTGKITSWDDVR